MNYLLNIHTATKTAMVSLSDENKVLAFLSNNESKNHAAFLHTAIHHILQENDISFSVLKAIGVTGGPGSYTGIRVGLATAKGLSYALKIPLVVCNTLEVMTHAAIEKIHDKEGLYIPMIDARRMEVFTAVYDAVFNIAEPPSALILEENYPARFPPEKHLYFFGNGSEKLKKIIPVSTNIFFVNVDITPESMAWFCWHKFSRQEVVNLANSQPFYVKDFHTNSKNL